MSTANEIQKITVSDISVLVVKKDIKNLHLSVLPPLGKVRVTAPFRMKDEAIRMAVVSRLSWIKKQQTKFQNQDRQTIREYVSGESHYLLGKSYRLKLVVKKGAPNVFTKGKTLIVIEIEENAPHEKLDKAFLKWYRENLRKISDSLLPKWEKKMDVKINKVGIRHMKTRWGSCNSVSKTIWLNLELIKKPTSCIEYVLAHEFCHVIEKKHNDKFLGLMNLHMPKWRMYKDELNRMPLAYEKWKY
ncbi:MAG TPA: M48 family metallopeptidase [Candidatus Wunengus sp. YC60]|uniref:M48 family metallopeptidase n=1 Tax=Candidatus Wunengus sp. YC60 TaxID=3367697 RepID=UPI0040277A38